ncbi:SDR family NAD(P)-dependent oxidoreductase [Conexibacter stalactiti]|uniref:SDR family NAD(P)-dependent oxidoreductase n=1 Tax=Conexibacter stalactiti TaxID=1940611 RepID=A0ABU4HLA8_9ACTN|nr:SDR family NAD(P)-dependent oxidoreductase [Conexibacter stalactiti]MDW5594106.1 SDR family NAD(P)-dependent oxidoreductase [Conexibacter stalactiti]MEC5034748.1 SDR family NAD(P)-dependent oxidoreductase [Conexibacter stalactiti]
MGLAEGRKALVTGGASGFGLEIARGLRDGGAAVAVVDVDPQRIDVAVAELGETAIGIAADVRSLAQMHDAVERCRAAFGGLDTVVVSAGVFHMGPLDGISEADWDRVLDVNLKGAFTTARAAMPDLRASGRGRMVTIGSDGGRRGYPLQLPYTASKFGLIGLTESLAAEFAGEGVTVNCVCPVGCPTTGMGQEVLARKVARGERTADEVIGAAALTNPVGRNATEADVAASALFLISDEASFLTGIALDVDGGAHLGAVPGIG